MYNDIMKKITTGIIFIFILGFGVQALADGDAKPGIKPDSFFYVFDTAFERAGLLLAFKDSTKASRAVKYADEKIAEAEALLDAGVPSHTIKAFKRYEEYVSLVMQKSVDAEDDEKKTELLIKLNNATSRHEEVLSRVLDKVPTEAKESIKRAMEVSRRGREEAINHAISIGEKIKELQDRVESMKKNQDK